MSYQTLQQKLSPFRCILQRALHIKYGQPWCITWHCSYISSQMPQLMSSARLFLEAQNRWRCNKYFLFMQWCLIVTGVHTPASQSQSNFSQASWYLINLFLLLFFVFFGSHTLPFAADSLCLLRATLWSRLVETLWQSKNMLSPLLWCHIWEACGI